MGVYAPNVFPGLELTLTAGAAITAGQYLYVSGSSTVSPSTGATIGGLGVAAFDCASAGLVTVYTAGVHTLAASGAIAAGANVVPAAAGAVADIGVGTTYDQVVGVALSAAANGFVTVLLR